MAINREFDSIVTSSSFMKLVCSATSRAARSAARRRARASCTATRAISSRAENGFGR